MSSEQPQLQAAPTVSERDDGDTDRPSLRSDGAGNVSNKNSTAFEVDEGLLRPLWIATKIATYPCAVCWIVLSVLILMCFLDSLVFAWADNTNRTWLVEDNKYTRQLDAWNLAQEAVGSSDGDNNDAAALPQTEETGDWTVFMLFELDNFEDGSNDWILTPSNLQTILKYEDDVLQDPKWQQYYCLVSDTFTYECDYYSLAQMVWEHFNYSYDGMNVSLIRQFVLSEHENEDSQAQVEASFDPNFADTAGNGIDGVQARLYRSFLLAGGPTPDNITVRSDGNVVKSSKYKNAEDDLEEQETAYEDNFALDLWVDITVKPDANLRDGNLRVALLIWAAYDAYAWILVNEAFLWIAAAMMAVLVWITIHLQSLFLSIMGVIGIMMSFPFAYFIYYFIYNVGYFDLLSSFIIFVLLGVGADDIFVFTDAWHQSVHFVKNPKDDVERMTFTYRRASKAMLVTQITTFFAFLATAFSNLLPIAAFGIWAATIVATDYILVITLYPAVLMIHHKYIAKYEQKYLCCCCFNSCFGLRAARDNAHNAHNARNGDKVEQGDKQLQTGIEMAQAGHDAVGTQSELQEAGASSGALESESHVLPALMRAASVEEQANEYRAIERFFGLKWAYMISKIKYVALVVFAIIFAISCWLATGLRPLDESETWFAEDHYMQKILSFSREFSVSEEDGLVDVFIVWGVDGVDRSDSFYWDPEDYGKVVWDEEFDMSSEDAQWFMYQVCVNLSESDLVYQKSSVTCPLNAFVNYTTSVNLTFPWTYMDPSDSDYDASVQKLKFAELMYEFSMSDEAHSVTSNSLLYVKRVSDGNYSIEYIAIEAFTDLSWDSTSTTSRKRRDDWIDWLDATFHENELCPDSVCNPMQVSSLWAWLVAQVEFVRSALQGIAIAMPIAFVVLILSTHNWIVAVFATLDIVGIMACALAVMDLFGWQFGISESISIVIIIGFSVDYVVHLANAYLESNAQSREERLQFALLTMGVSVASGAVTTFLSGFFMQFPQMQLFFKMGVIILATILWSIIWALFFFTSLLAAFGPQGDTGNIPFDKITKHCKRIITRDSRE